MYKFFQTREVSIGNIKIGANNPIRIQSMTNTDTLDIEATTNQIMDLSDLGCEIARVTVQGQKQAYACENIKNALLKKGYTIPLVADIHFYPPAAIIVSDFVDKIRINPGNYAEKRAVFKKLDLTDSEYQHELEKVEKKLVELINKLKKNKVALRIGVNHGSLSDRIMTKYGNTIKGMVVSAIEYTKICRDYGFHNLVFSMKSSNPKIMIQAYRSLVDEMKILNWNYPLHLGVTEAGMGEDGTIKSAVGIGSLLLDGIGDTIRVSLTDDPTFEIKPAKKLALFAEKYSNASFFEKPISKNNKNALIAIEKHIEGKGKENIDIVLSDKKTSILHLDDTFEDMDLKSIKYTIFKTSFPNVYNVRKLFFSLQKNNIKTLVLLDIKELILDLDVISEMGALFIDGLIDGVLIKNEQKEKILNVMQACSKKNTKTEFISCPGCGRTLFNIQKAVKELKQKIPNTPGLKIAIMGCIVNGPGEMQDADFGYVGAGSGKVDLYVDQKLYEKNIDEKEATFKLLELIEQKHALAFK